MVILLGLIHDFHECPKHLQISSLKYIDAACFNKLIKQTSFADIEKVRERPLPYVYGKYFKSTDWAVRALLLNSPENSLLATQFYLNFDQKSHYSFNKLQSKSGEFDLKKLANNRNCDAKFYRKEDGSEYVVQRCLNIVNQTSNVPEDYYTEKASDFETRDLKDKYLLKFAYFDPFNINRVVKKLTKAFTPTSKADAIPFSAVHDLVN